MKRIKKGDEVIVIAGKDKGRRGTVISVDDDRVLIEGINVVKKHQKPKKLLKEKARVTRQKVSVGLNPRSGRETEE